MINPSGSKGTVFRGAWTTCTAPFISEARFQWCSYRWRLPMLNRSGPTSMLSIDATISWRVLHSKALMPDQPHITSFDRTVTVRYSLPSLFWNWRKSLQGMSSPGSVSVRGS